MNRYTDYDDFAWLYNREWRAFGENIFPGLKAIAGDKLPDGANILDLCCGTGQLAKVLIEKGYRVTGIDGSDEMLRYAKENAPEAKFLLRDARAFQLPPEYHAVFSTFDALNHIMTIEELEKVFTNVFRCLAHSGIFIFDLTMQKHFETYQKGFKEIKETPDYFYTMRINYDPEKRISQWICTIFQPESKLWKRSEIVLYQTWFPLEEIKSSLGKAGFTGARAYSFNPQRELEEATKDSTRVFFLAEKP